MFSCNVVSRLACVASVSNRVIARKLERKVEEGEVGGGEKRFLLSPSPPPSILFFFCSRPDVLDELARKRLLRRLSPDGTYS